MAKTKTKAKTKTRPRTKAKTKAPKAAKKPKPKSRPTAKECVALARAGKVEALFALCDLDSSTSNDRDAYKWLNAAFDFGHKKAAERIDDVMEVSSMRYDDDAYEVAAAHWELGTAYLEGKDGLPLDLALAKNHLGEAFRVHDLEGIRSGTQVKYDVKPLLKRLTGDAKKLLDSALAGDIDPPATDFDDDDD